MHMRKGTSADYPAILELFNKLSWDYKFPDIDELVDIQVETQPCCVVRKKQPEFLNSAGQR